MRAIDWLAPIRNRVPSIYRPRPRRRRKPWQPIAAQVERMEDRTLLSSAPIFDAPSYSFTLGDDATSGQAVGTVSATDPDPGDMVMYGITDGDPSGVFAIDSMTGQISVMDDTSLNGGQTYVLTVEASDGLLSDSVSVTIDVVETNLPPVFDQPSYAFPLGDDASSGTVVGTVSATDPNPSDFLSYYIAAGDPESIFVIDFMTGQISVMDPMPLDGGDSFVLTVEVSDGEATDSVSVTIDVTETNLPPTFDQPSYAFDLGDDATMGQLVGTVTATDPNPSDFLSYSITGGDPSAIFSIDFMSGQITVADPSTLDGGQVFNLTVQVSDGEATDSVPVTINVMETNIPPTFDAPSYTFEIPEDANMGDPVGTVTASDPNPSDMLMYSITAGNTGSAFTIDSMTGAITVMDNFVLSAGQEYTLTVEASDGEDTASVNVTIDVVAGTPIPNTPPTAGDDGPFSVLHSRMHTQSTADILSNDFDMDPGDTLTAIIDTLPANGELRKSDLTLLAVGDTLDDTFIYNPNFGAVGEDSFTYYVTDGLDNSSPATVTFDVYNTPPVANDDYFEVDPIAPGDSYTLSGVLANDYDMDGDAITISLVRAPSSATSFTLNSDGSFTYTPISSSVTPWPGYDDFDYQISDGIATSIATAYIDETLWTGTSGEPSEDALDGGAGGDEVAVSISATAFSYSVAPDVGQMKPWGFIFTWAVAFDATAAGQFVHQWIHTRVTLKDRAGLPLYWIDTQIVDLSVIQAPDYNIGDIQDATAFETKIVDWVLRDRRVATIEFSRRADFRLVDAVRVKPVGAADFEPYDPATHGTGLADRHYRDSDGVETHSSAMQPLGGGAAIGGGAQLFESLGPVGQANYRIVWWDKVNSDIARSWRFNPWGALPQLTKRGRLKFDQGIGGAPGADGLPVFPEKSTLDPTVPGGIDRVFGPVTDPL